ncbi:hypothetical protein [Bacillus sp. NPDC077027]|uniref:hypothetical protein n=1 Tax=Bacillus sp. NPDC077027 TaxID=3390548 RepID=UPI003D06C355
MSESDKLKLGQLYAQDSWHMEACIIGNKEGLLELRDAIDVALQKKIGVAHLFPADYEGYETYVALVDEDEVFESLCLPYRDEYAQSEENALDPFDIVKQYEKEKGQK